MAPRFLFILLSAVSSLSGLYGQYVPFMPYCSITDNYTIGSPYQENLATLMNALPSNAIANGGFSNSTAGEAPDKVFGLMMCYADGNLTECQKCLISAAAGIQLACPFSWVARSIYDTCVLQYSNEPFFSVADTTILAFSLFADSADVLGVSSMNATRSNLLSRLSVEATGTSLLWTNGSDRYTDSQGMFQEVYGFTQCTRDLNASECIRCFTNFVSFIWSEQRMANKSFGALYGYSCHMRYQVGYPIATITIFPIAEPPQQLPPSPRRPQPPAPASSRPSTMPATTRRSALVAGASAGSIVFAIIAGICLWFSLRRHPKGNESAREQQLVEEQPIKGFHQAMGPRRFHYNELAIATNYFSDEGKLGEGGFGSVYRGYLKDENLYIAVKRFSKTSEQGEKEYVSEVTIISGLSHRNLVQLMGWCHGGGEFLLVYELMSNGSLDMHIYNPETVLLWPVRYEIVIGMGSALLYLHQDCKQCVLHRDIKPSNLMLDDSFNVKLGDFGLARLEKHGQGSHTTTLAGTMGYMDPESLVSGRACTDSDIYSFGVVILEIACGRRPIQGLRENEASTMHLVQFVWELYGAGNILGAVDPRLNVTLDSQEMQCVMIVVLWCTHRDRSLRPSIRQAMNVLRLEAPLPILPAKMPVAMFVPPVDSLLSQSLSAKAMSRGSSSGAGATHSSTYTTGNTRSSIGLHDDRI